MNSRRFQILQSKRKHNHDLKRAGHIRNLMKHKMEVKIEDRMSEARPLTVEYVKLEARVEKPGFFKRLFQRMT